MEKYSASYTYTNCNFVIQNLQASKDTNNKYYPYICVLKNIIQRGCPTYMSQYLIEKIGDIDLEEKQLLGLIDNEIPKWINTIKGDDDNNDYPAKVFFDNLIPKYLGEYKFIQQLILPEVEINDIVGREHEQFKNQRVDFYLDQCKLVIEIDGYHHKKEIQKSTDYERDEYLYKNGVYTVRINTKNLREENEVFIEKINLILSRLNQYENRLNLYENFCDIDNLDEKKLKYFKSNAVIRMQLLILSLLEKGKLKLDDDLWRFNILQRDVYDFIEIAIEDLFIWFENLCLLNEVSFTRPKLEIIKHRNQSEFLYKNGYINIDFSLNKRWTDENEFNKNIIYVRTDYFDKRRYFKVSTTDPICYKINKEDDRCINSFNFLLKNIFGHDTFRDGQLPIIINSLQGEDTIGILPTGTGKSVCYQLTALLQPAISFVVCPIKSLIYDQKINLNNKKIDNIECITGDIEGDKKSEIMESFSNEKYQIIFISPERFQLQKFRESLSTLNKNSSIGLAVIDEVHCLSEWGHDFRTSYLNLVKTIRKFTPSARLLGLTATASNFVLQDIKREFEIDSYNVKTLTSFTREELHFKVIECDKESGLTKKDTLLEKLKELNESKNVFELDGKDTKSGIIFTLTVNGKKGCYNLSNNINHKFNIKSDFYSGEAPKEKKIPIMESKAFNKHKEKVQKDFKENKIPLLVTTKAFGMGVDKPNIRYTIHFGMPMSLESLYQEAGRAGRDKKDADCYVLYSHETIEEEILNKFFSLDISVEELKDIQKDIDYNNQKDVLSNFFLWLSNNKGVEHEFNVIKSICYTYLKIDEGQSEVQGGTKEVTCRELKHSFGDVQKAIYRLSVLGIVDDWTIETWDSKSAKMVVKFKNKVDIQSIYKEMENYIKKYHKEFDLNEIKENKFNLENKKTYTQMNQAFEDESMNEIEKVIKALLIWVYDNIIYKRRQSIKTISDLCKEFKDEDEFKQHIEAHFKFNDDTYVLDAIAENPKDYTKWFDIFTNSDGSIDKKKAKNIKGTIGRFLESYRYNTGLNFISGIIRLMENDYNNLDGKQRLESAFEQIQTYDEEVKQNILEFSLQAGKELDNQNKIYLSELLCNNYDDKLKIHESLEDNHSLALIVEETNDKLRNISRRIKCQKQKNY